MNPHMLNPAGRLYEFMLHTWESNQQEGLSASWRRYLGVESPTDHASFYGALASVLRLPKQVRERVAALEGPPIPMSQLLRGVDGANSLLDLANSVESINIEGARQRFDKGTLTDLETCSHILNNLLAALPGEEGDGETPLGAIRRLAEEIVSEVTAEGSTLPPEVTRVLLDYAASIVRAVDLYKITGVEGIVKEFEGLVGALVTSPSALSSLRGAPKVWTKFIDMSKQVLILSAVLAVPGQLAIEAGKAYKAIEPLFEAVSHLHG